MALVEREVWRRTCDVVVPGPEVDVDGVQDRKQGEPPTNAIDDDLLATLKELVDYSPEEKEVDERPDPTLGQEHKEW